MAFPTLGQIASLRQPTGLENLGKILSSGYQSYLQADNTRQEREAAKSSAQKEAQAANFLKQAIQEQDPKKSEAFIMEAFKASPDTVSSFFDIQGKRTQMEGKPKQITDYQKASIELRREQLELDKLKAQQAKESNQLKKEQIKAAIESKKAKLQENETAIKDSVAKDVATFDSTLNTVDQLINHKGLEAAVGGSSIFPTVAGSEAANFEAKLEQLKSQQFLTEIQKMKGLGALSENEGKKLGAAAASLDLKMSEDAFREELKYIQETMQKARNKIAGKLPKEEIESNKGTMQVDQMSDDELLQSLGF